MRFVARAEKSEGLLLKTKDPMIKVSKYLIKHFLMKTHWFNAGFPMSFKPSSYSRALFWCLACLRLFTFLLEAELSPEVFSFQKLKETNNKKKGSETI